MLANPEKYDDDMREIYSRIIANYLQPTQRDLIRKKYSPSGYSSKTIPLPSKADKALPNELTKRRKSATFADGTTVMIGGKFDRLAIEHATLHRGLRTPWQPLTVIGHYTIKYEDSTELCIPVEYAGNVQCLDHRYGDPFPEPAHRHTGYFGTWFSDPTLETHQGDEKRLLLTEFIFENPKPMTNIISLSYTAEKDDFTTLILTGLRGLKKR